MTLTVKMALHTQQLLKSVICTDTYHLWHSQTLPPASNQIAKCQAGTQVTESECDQPHSAWGCRSGPPPRWAPARPSRENTRCSQRPQLPRPHPHDSAPRRAAHVQSALLPQRLMTLDADPRRGCLARLPRMEPPRPARRPARRQAPCWRQPPGLVPPAPATVAAARTAGA